MKLVLQPTRSRCCGQACVAMIAELSLWSACDVFGHRHATTTKHVTEALVRLGIDHKPLVRAEEYMVPVDRAIVRLHWGLKRQGSHWIVLYDGNVYDPCYGFNPQWDHAPKVRYTSFIELPKPIEKDS